MEIRKYIAGDENALYDVFYSAIHENAQEQYSSDQLNAWASGYTDREKWKRRIQDIDPYVAVDKGIIRGYADLQENGFIDHFFVQGGYSRRGIGSELLKNIISEAEKRGIAELTSHVSLTAERLFLKHGFKIVSRKKVIIKGVELDNTLMRKEIDRDKSSEKKGEIKLWESVVSLGLSILTLFLLNGFVYGRLSERLMGGSGTCTLIPIINISALHSYTPLWNISLGLTMVLQIMHLVLRKREWRGRMVERVTTVFDMLILITMIKGPMMIVPRALEAAFTPSTGSVLANIIANADRYYDLALAVLIILSALDLVAGLRGRGGKRA